MAVRANCARDQSINEVMFQVFEKSFGTDANRVIAIRARIVGAQHLCTVAIIRTLEFRLEKIFIFFIIVVVIRYDQSTIVSEDVIHFRIECIVDEDILNFSPLGDIAHVVIERPAQIL